MLISDAFYLKTRNYLIVKSMLILSWNGNRNKPRKSWDTVKYRSAKLYFIHTLQILIRVGCLARVQILPRAMIILRRRHAGFNE